VRAESDETAPRDERRGGGFSGLGRPCVRRAEIQGFERGESLITAEELKKLIDAKDPSVVLAVVEPVSYRAGHIPGPSTSGVRLRAQGR